MKYVSELYIDGVRRRVYSSVELSDSVRIVIRDTDKGGSAEVVGEEIQWVKAIGLCCHLRPWPGVVIVTHDLKSASLYNHIVRVSTSYTGYTYRGTNGDVIVTSSDLSRSTKSVILGHFDELVIDKWGYMIESNGYEGFVIKSDILVTGAEPYGTVYGVLCTLCKSLDINLMKYKRVIIASKSYNYHTVIEFKHTIAAERFFTKMYMDVFSK